MQESAQLQTEKIEGNALINIDQGNSDKVIYDTEAENRFEFEAKGADGNLYDTAHRFKPLSDDRYWQFIREFKVEQKGDEIEEDVRGAYISLWHDLIIEVENIEVKDGEDWKDLILDDEKIGAGEFLLTVVIYEGEKKTGARKLAKDASITVETEAYFNGEVARQKHLLREKTIEHQKKYSRIIDRRLQTERTRGLKRKPKVEFHPQNQAIGRLYDEMILSTEGFEGEVPLRFKETVINHIFEAGLKQKRKKPLANAQD